VNAERLLNVAKALRESPAPEKFDMGDYVDFECGTPACALGHYGARRDLQNVFVIDGGSVEGFGLSTVDRGAPFFRTVIEHFGLEPGEDDELFGTDGCGEAKTAIEAAEYIERWVAERQAKP
jgi:hypothetical protein